MSPLTVRAEADSNSDISETYEVNSQGIKKELYAEENHTEEETKTTHSTRHGKKGSAKFDAALQAFSEHENYSNSNHRGVNHRPPISIEDDSHTVKKDGRRNNSRNSTGRASEESVRSSGRRSGDGGSRKSLDSTTNRKSTDSQRSGSSEKVSCDDSSDQLSQITDILLARLITTLSDSTLGNPALLLQTLLGFSPDDYSDLLAALSESHLSYVDIISAYLHNIRVMSEDSGSTSAALSGTLTRSLIEQYNSLLAQAVKSPQSIARANLISDSDGRSNLADLLQKANSNDNRQDKRSFDNTLPKGPSGLGFGRRHSVDANKQRQNFLQPNGGGGTETLQKSVNQNDNPMLDLAKFLNISKMHSQDLNGANGNPLGAPSSALTGGGGVSGAIDVPSAVNMAVPGNFGGMNPDQLTALLQNAGMLHSGATGHFVPPAGTHVQSNVPSLPFVLNPTTQLPLNGMMATNHGYGMPQMQPWISNATMPSVQQIPVPNRNLWQGTSNCNGNGATATPVGSGGGNASNGGHAAAAAAAAAAYSSFRGWGPSLETVPENFNSPLSLYQDQQHCFPTAINMQQPSQQ